MRLLARFPAITALVLLTACATSGYPSKHAAGNEPAIMQRAQLLLDRYARNDQAGVIALVDPERLTIIGTGVDEVVKSPADLRALMDRDFKQWQSATFTDMREMDVRSNGNLATAHFLVTFAAAHGPSVPLRMFTTWHRVNGEWLLTQCGTAIPPQG
jgi:hypothetical protein